MPDYRIVFNEHSGQYRIERRSLWGWSFLTDGGGREYLTFADYEAARRHLCRRLKRRVHTHRRWRVLDLCRCPRTVDSRRRAAQTLCGPIAPDIRPSRSLRSAEGPSTVGSCLQPGQALTCVIASGGCRAILGGQVIRFAARGIVGILTRVIELLVVLVTCAAIGAVLGILVGTHVDAVIAGAVLGGVFGVGLFAVQWIVRGR